jgi:DNA polymerase elongation subunit (family B)
VASYYPAIILNCGLYPKQLGTAFLDVYRAIVNERLDAKHAGDKVKADALKIVVNGSFGKLGSPYSALYAPELMVQVTVTGQLSLLMLIESLEENGIPVLSANTDGIVIGCPVDLQDKMTILINDWQDATEFIMEQSTYAGIYSRDVNNYIAITHSGKVKTKGCFKAGDLAKNPSNEICNIALIRYLMHGTSFEETIESCTDITKFITLRNVNGGAVCKDKYLGKAIRWYYAKGSKETINYKKNGNLVPRSYGAKPLMDLPEQFPTDIDYEWYLAECYNLF